MLYGICVKVEWYRSKEKSGLYGECKRDIFYIFFEVYLLTLFLFFKVLAYMYTESAFHHQSYEILKDLEPYMRDLTGLLHDVSIIFNSRHFILIIVL